MKTSTGLTLTVTLPLTAAVAALALGSPVLAAERIPFGDEVAIAYPIGAYPHEFVPGHETDVVFSVHDPERLSGTGQDRAGFSLTVTVEGLGRTLGLGGMELVCVADGAETGPVESDDAHGELDATATFTYTCPYPVEAQELEVVFTHRDTTARFFGPV